MYDLRDMFNFAKLISKHFKIKFGSDLFHIKKYINFDTRKVKEKSFKNAIVVMNV